MEQQDEHKQEYTLTARALIFLFIILWCAVIAYGWGYAEGEKHAEREKLTEQQPKEKEHRKESKRVPVEVPEGEAEEEV